MLEPPHQNITLRRVEVTLRTARKAFADVDLADALHALFAFFLFSRSLRLRVMSPP